MASKNRLKKASVPSQAQLVPKNQLPPKNQLTQGESVQNGLAQTELATYLEENARHLSAFQAIALIEDTLSPGQEVGTHALARDEKLFFEVDHSLGFPLSDVVRITPLLPTSEENQAQGLEQFSKSVARFSDKNCGKNKELEPFVEPSETKTALDQELLPERYRMMVTFLGLHGSGTPLPSFYAEQIARYDRDESISKAFFDFFHNRIVGFLYRSWRKFRYYRRYRQGARDPFSSWIYALFGLGHKSLRAPSPVYWPQFFCFAGMLSTRHRSPALICALITHAFQLPFVDMEQWVLRKITIPDDQKNRLGRANATLGHDFAIGGKVRDIQGKVRIVLAGLSFQRFQDFLPSGKDFDTLRGLIEFTLRDQLAYDLKLGLMPDEAHPLTLSKDCQGRLGWSSFLGSKAAHQSRDVIIRVRR